MTTNDPRAVGFVGLGRMGSRIAANLAKAGHDVAVWNRTPSVSEQWVEENGGVVAPSLPDLARANEFVITMLADGEALESVYESGGLLDGIEDTIGIDMGTSGPQSFGRVRARIEEAGAAIVDAPVSGSTAAAEAASLLIMVGSDDLFEKVKPVLDAVGNPVHVGPTGSAAVLKLAVNSVLYGLSQAVAEAVALAEKSGVKPETTMDILTKGAAGAPMLSYRREQYLHPETAPITFTVDLARKDLTLAMEQARRTGAPTGQLERTMELLDNLVEQGHGSQDMAYVVEAARRAQ
jgi:3-hydroxyisobutyrate dehydrogenase-like beta-hydroxyacid dehydrogenase